MEQGTGVEPAFTAWEAVECGAESLGFVHIWYLLKKWFGHIFVIIPREGQNRQEKISENGALQTEKKVL